jgi:hypothetical protein
MQCAVVPVACYAVTAIASLKRYITLHAVKYHTTTLIHCTQNRSRIREFQEVAGLRPVLDDDGYQSEDDENGSNGRLRKTEKVNPQVCLYYYTL